MFSDPTDEARRKLDYIDAQLTDVARAGEKLDHLTDVRADVIRKFPDLARPEPKRARPPKAEKPPANGGYDPFDALCYHSPTP